MDIYVTLAFMKDQQRAWFIILKFSKYHFSIHICSWHTNICIRRAGFSPIEHKNITAGCHSLPSIAVYTAGLLLVQQMGEDRIPPQFSLMPLQTQANQVVCAGVSSCRASTSEVCICSGVHKF